MDELTEQEMAHFSGLLNRRRDELLAVAGIGLEAADTVELDQTRVGRLSRMDAMQSQAMSRETNRRRELELRRIGAALRRLEEGDYGWCLQCGEPIAKGRLQVDPAAPHCLDCAEKQERS